MNSCSWGGLFKKCILLKGGYIMKTSLPVLTSFKDMWADFDRFFIGFDDMIRDMDRIFSTQRSVSYPPCNILKDEQGNIEITLAVAGFNKDDIEVTLSENNVLTVSGRSQTQQASDKRFILQGIATRQFTRSWSLGKDVEVGDIKMKDGLLTINIKQLAPPAPEIKRLTIATE